MKLIVTTNSEKARLIAKALDVPFNVEYNFYENNEYQIISMGYINFKINNNGSNLPASPNEFNVEINDTNEEANLLKKLFNEADEIIYASDMSYEKEFIFHNLYSYFEEDKPIKRLLITSDERMKIRLSFYSLKELMLYDNHYQASKAKKISDWILGVYASEKLRILAGRVSNPTLALICKKYNEYTTFEQKPYYRCKLSLNVNDEVLENVYDEEYYSYEEAEHKVQNLTEKIEVSDVAKETIKEPAPLPFNLSALQESAEKLFGYTAEETLKIARELYNNKGMISNPCTHYRCLTKDKYEEVRVKAKQLKSYIGDEIFADCCDCVYDRANDASIKKGIDKYAIIPTFDIKTGLDERCSNIYKLICRQTLMAVLFPCEKEKTTITFKQGNNNFKVEHFKIKKEAKSQIYNWRLLSDTNKTETKVPNVKVGDLYKIIDCTIEETNVEIPELYTESTLYKEMENSGIGTNNTRTDILEKLRNKKYITAEEGKLVPTEEGLYIYNLIKDTDIATSDLTKTLEERYKLISEGELDADEYYKWIVEFVEKRLEEILSRARTL